MEMAELTLVKAALIPMLGGTPEPDTSKHIFVQFNPASLRVSLSNSIRADGGAKAASSGVQYVDRSVSTLSVVLLFDTSVARQPTKQMSNVQHSANSDVRLLTKAIASEFMQPQGDPETPTAPKVCRFQWGAFVFVGMLSRFDENLEFFSPEGIPLRATLSLSFKENRYQFETLDVTASARKKPSFVKASNKGIAQSLADEGKDPKEWREIALLNGIENPRLLSATQLAQDGLQKAITPLLNPESLAGVMQAKKALDPIINNLVSSAPSTDSAAKLAIDSAQTIPNYIQG